MNKEQELEQVANAIRRFDVPKAPPVFELYVSLVGISISILLFLLPGVFVQTDAPFYVLMRSVLPQGGWGAAFFLGGVLSAVGMLLDNHFVRVVALVFLTATFGIVAAFYVATFPNLAGILMFWTTVFAAASIPLVRHTGVRAFDKNR